MYLYGGFVGFSKTSQNLVQVTHYVCEETNANDL